jgi:mercuric ion binding protein
MKTLLAATAALSLLASPGWAASKTVTLDVPGMFCAACPITVKKALTKVTGVAEVNVDLDKKQAVVTFDDAKTRIATLTKATTNAGYPSTVKTK